MPTHNLPTDDSGCLAGRIAVVTGGGRGIGLAVARAAAQAGADVALLDLLTDLEECAEELATTTGRRVIGVRTDVTDPDAIAAAFDATERRLGRADALVNCAGIAHNVDAHESDPADFRRVIDVNLTGTYLVAREFGRRLIAAEAPGSAVNISSMSGIVVNVPQPQAAYNASKAGVAMLTKSLAVEWVRHRIRFNSVAPGYIATDMTKQVMQAEPDMAGEWLRRTPVDRFGTPEDVADAVVFLLSDRARFIVGHDLVVDGGYTLV